MLVGSALAVVCLLMGLLNWRWRRRWAAQVLGNTAGDAELTNLGNKIGAVAIVGAIATACLVFVQFTF